MSSENGGAASAAPRLSAVLDRIMAEAVDAVMDVDCDLLGVLARDVGVMESRLRREESEGLYQVYEADTAEALLGLMARAANLLPALGEDREWAGMLLLAEHRWGTLLIEQDRWAGLLGGEHG